MNSILVTGADGFIGSALVERLVQHNHGVIAASRRPTVAGTASLGNHVRSRFFELTSKENDFDALLDGVEAIVHLAARVHVRAKTESSRGSYQRVNADGTSVLLREAAQRGVRRFVFLSSIGVNGISSSSGPFSEEQPARPFNEYTASKYEAELAIRAISEDHPIEYVILRTPLVYGPGVKSTFLALMRFVAAGYPLPIGRLTAPRSMLYIDNLNDVLIQCLTDGRASNQLFLVSDDTLSVRDLAIALADALDRPVRMFPCPFFVLRSIARAARISALSSALNPSVIDNSKLRDTLTWSPKHVLEDNLLATARWYLNDHSR